MSPDVTVSNGHTFHVERAIAGNKSLYVGGERNAVTAIIDAERVDKVVKTPGEQPEALIQDSEPVEQVIFPKEEPAATVHELLEVTA
jgi:hypothetical protein